MWQVGYLITALDTSVTPITHELYDWSTAQNSALFAGLAVVAAMMVVVMRAGSKRAERRSSPAEQVTRRYMCEPSAGAYGVTMHLV